MCTSNFNSFKKLSNKQAKFIKSLRFKKYRQQENAFVVEGAKNVALLLQSSYVVYLVVGTPTFIASHATLLQRRDIEIFQIGETDLAALGTLKTNNAALAVASIPTPPPLEDISNTCGLVLDDIRDPGNLGTIIRIADWYNIPNLVCSLNTVDLYNPKVLQSSMGSFARVKVYYSHLPGYLSDTSLPILGTFTTGNNLYHTSLPDPSLIVIGNESHGISQEVLPYIQQRITIPRYGHAESLNAATATAVVCDNWRRQQSSEPY